MSDLCWCNNLLSDKITKKKNCYFVMGWLLLPSGSPFKHHPSTTLYHAVRVYSDAPTCHLKCLMLNTSRITRVPTCKNKKKNKKLCTLVL